MKSYYFKDIATLKYGKDKKIADKVTGGNPILGTGGIIGTTGLFLYDKPSVLIGRKGSIETTYFIDKPFWTIDTLFYTEINEEIVLPKWFYYLTKRINFKRYQEGTGVPSLTVATINKIKINVPSIEEQKNVLSSLNPIDEKIDLNHRMISDLEEYSQLLFHKWFIDFNFPDESGNPYKDSGGEMIEVEEGVIPSDWNWENICDVADIVDCLHSKKPNNDGKNPHKCLLQLENISYYGLLNLRNLYMVNDKVYSTWTNRIEVREGDIIVTNAGRVGAIARIPKGCKFGIGRNITAIRPNLISPTWFYLYFTSKTIQSQIKRNTDKGSFFGSLNVRGIKQLQILVPKREIIVEFEKQAKPIREKVELLNEEIQKLEEFRDLLIKKLIK